MSSLCLLLPCCLVLIPGRLVRRLRARGGARVLETGLQGSKVCREVTYTLKMCREKLDAESYAMRENTGEMQADTARVCVRYDQWLIVRSQDKCHVCASFHRLFSSPLSLAWSTSQALVFVVGFKVDRA